MRTRNIIIILVTIAVVAIAWNVSRQKAPTTEITNARLYPALIDKLNEVHRLSIQTTKSSTDLVNEGEHWVVANRDDFPAKFATIKSTLLNIANTTVVEKKTSKPDRYAQIGVSDLNEPDSAATLVKIESADGTALVSLLVGEERSTGQLNSRQFYVRKSDTPTSLLVEGELDLDSKPSEWMDTSLVNIRTDRVRKVTLTRGDNPPLVVTKAKHGENFFELEGIPNGFVAKSRAVVSSLGALLLDMKFDNVASVAKISDKTPVATAEIRTFDGLVADLQQFEIDDTLFVRLHFSFDPKGVVEETPETADKPEQNDAATAEEQSSAEKPSVPDEVASLNAKVADWIYALPEYKNRMLEKSLDDMIKPAEEEKVLEEGDKGATEDGKAAAE